ncbi:MAG: hypothetical protein R6U21_07295 [Thermoplasmatota archaeon]
MKRKQKKKQRKKFWSNTQALSVMYDAVLFLVLVSLSGVILFPALQPQILSDVTIEELNEKKVDDIHHMILCSTPKQCQYSVAGNLIDEAAVTLGINTTQEDGLYQTIIDRVIGHELHHSTFAQLIVENLAVQWQFSLFNQSVDQLNMLTSEYSSALTEEIQSFLDEQLSQQYHYQFNAQWYPITGISFGGSLSAGEPPPKTNYFISKKTVSMPFSPALSWDDKTVVFSEYWIESMFLDLFNEKQNQLVNISMITQKIHNQTDLVNDSQLFKQRLSENLTDLFIDFTVDGMYLTNNSLFFPGVASILIDELLSSLFALIHDVADETIQTVIGDGMAQVESFFTEINATSLIQPIEDMIVSEVTAFISDALNTSFSSIDHAIHQLKEQIKQFIAEELFQLFQPLALQCATMIIDHELSLVESINMISSYIADQFSISQATMTLTIWEK